jgi:hypothetical protein
MHDMAYNASRTVIFSDVQRFDQRAARTSGNECCAALMIQDHGMHGFSGVEPQAVVASCNQNQHKSTARAFHCEQEGAAVVLQGDALHHAHDVEFCVIILSVFQGLRKSAARIVMVMVMVMVMVVVIALVLLFVLRCFLPSALTPAQCSHQITSIYFQMASSEDLWGCFGRV